jgi:hydroxyethylthiazole kinase-like uncharacterized protein yjeF
LKYTRPDERAMISQEEMRVLDRNCQFFGISIQGLMENAGRTVAEAVLSKFDGKGKTVLVVCGTGNNGGDGLTAARYLKNESKVIIVLARAAEKLATKEAKEAYSKVKGQVDIIEAPSGFEELLANSDLLGIGMRGEIQEPYASMIHKINSCGKPILAVDVPSGLGANIMVKPTATVALHEVKVGMTPENSGEIIVSDIGIPREFTSRVGPGEFLYYPRKKEGSHKGDNGRLLVVGGGPFTGAPAFVGLAAYRIGTDVVHIATPALAYSIVASFSPNFIVHQLAGTRLLRADISQILEVASSMDAIVIGPGLGSTDSTLDAVRELIKAVHVPLVIDADAITAVSKDLNCLRGKKGVITPHAREYQTLSGERRSDDLAQRSEAVKAFAKRVGFTILLKGPTDIITDGERLKYNVTHNAGMTVGGTGDSLAGIAGGLLAKRVRPFEAARIAAFTNGQAGNLAFKEKSYGMMTSDIIEKIPSVLLEFL